MTLTITLPTRSHAQEELRAWAQVPDDLIDLGAAALALASLRQTQRDPLPYREHLDRLAVEVAAMAQTIKPTRVEQVAALLREVLHLRHGYTGDSKDYNSPDNANLMKVIDRRRGLPVALGIIWLTVARVNGWQAVGINFPEHFLVRLEFGGRRLIVDPFNGGEMVAVPQLRQLLKIHLGPQAELKPEYYLPIGNRDILLRLQNNLKLRFAHSGMDEAAAEILEGMLLLAPERAALWREFGLTLARLGEEHRAIIALENFLTLSVDDPLRHQTASLVEQLRALTASSGP